jgi:hypothetical protein
MGIPYHKMQGIQLDVSARQTLKTTRLIQAIEKHLKEHSFNRAVVVCMNHSMCSEMRTRLAVRGILIHSVKIVEQSQYEIEIERITDFERTRFFFDEFDHFQYQCTIVEYGYYSTSPRFIRTIHDDTGESGENWHEDTLMILTKIAYKIVKIRNPAKMHDQKHLMLPEQWETEILGKFVHA